jgi:uncharacterized membrane protein YkoI
MIYSTLKDKFAVGQNGVKAVLLKAFAVPLIVVVTGLVAGVMIVGAAPSYAAEAYAVEAYAGKALVTLAQDNDHDDALKAIKRGEILSYDRIKSIAERELDGKMVGERLRRTNQGWVYEVRVRRRDGKVVFAIINAGSGKVISKRQ